jgi:hypothetical protein
VAQKVQNETYWYEAEILCRTASGYADKTVQRQGTLHGNGPLDALDALYEKADESWNGMIVKAKVCTVDKHGEIVATTTSSRHPENTERSHSVTTSSVYDWAHNMGGNRVFPIMSLRRYMS